MAIFICLAVLSFTGTAYPFLEKQSIRVNIYLYPLFSPAYGIISTKSACSKSPIPSTFTLRLGNLLRAGLCNSWAIFSLIPIFIIKIIYNIGQIYTYICHCLQDFVYRLPKTHNLLSNKTHTYP